MLATAGSVPTVAPPDFSRSLLRAQRRSEPIFAVSALAGTHSRRSSLQSITKRRHAYDRASRRSATAPHAAASIAESDERHAVLHDFCMVIPYSCIIAAAGVLSVVLGNGWKGLLVAAAGVLELFLTLQSLKRWRAGSGHRLFTTATAGIAGWLCFQFKGSVRDGTAVWPNRVLLWLSAAATLFLVYNVLAGGNPPKEDEAVTAADSTTPQKSF